MSPVLAVAVSGGRDSTALLHAVQRQARAGGLTVVALHVHHGLNPAADSWVRHIKGQCQRWRVRCRVVRLEGAPGAGQSVEAWARDARYRALTQLAYEEGATHVLLAHHRRDQAETVLLQALRGAGPAGLAAMPAQVLRQGLWWCRPWLQQPASAIEAYVQRWRLSHIDDDSNDDQRFDRNRLRHSVWPALLAAFPQAETALMAVAHQAHAADQAIQALGAQALQAIRADDGLPVAAWAALGLAARRASLQCWLREQLGQGPSELLLARLLTELPGRRQGRFSVDALRELRLYRGTMQLQWLGAAGPAPPSSAPEPLTEPLPETDWRRVGVHALPDRLGVLTVKVVAQGGIALADLAGAQLRPRRGGEQFQLSPGGVARSLKKQYQALGVPAWARTGPLVWVGELLVFVPGLGLDARCWAAAGVAQVSLHWRAGTRAP